MDIVVCITQDSRVRTAKLTLTSVLQEHPLVTLMLIALTPKDLTTALVNLVIKEMGGNVKMLMNVPQKHATVLPIFPATLPRDHLTANASESVLIRLYFTLAKWLQRWIPD
ncbi:uncharacterized protein LOC110066411 [Orbicella faveolata]|uniref:uncharacterized protein LOC110066411 n=1 Tax=Orbicella faveolata TaxID=48498 RepID=UPI0009E18D6E|nr:uncharacterized protein LOC110066411 [Orbicella faveolata]